MGNEKDFLVKNGYLRKYHGSGGDVVIPDTVSILNDRVFKECDKITSVTIPDGVKNIGNGTFTKCSALTILNDFL